MAEFLSTNLSSNSLRSRAKKAFDVAARLFRQMPTRESKAGLLTAIEAYQAAYDCVGYQDDKSHRDWAFNQIRESERYSESLAKRREGTSPQEEL